MCVCEQAGDWAYWNLSFDTHLRYLRPVSCFFPIWILLAYKVSGNYSSQRLDSCHILCLLMWQATFFVDTLWGHSFKCNSRNLLSGFFFFLISFLEFWMLEFAISFDNQFEFLFHSILSWQSKHTNTFFPKSARPILQYCLSLSAWPA